MTEEAALSEIEEKLKADDSGQEKDAMTELLNGAAEAVKKTMDSGVSPAEFASLEAQYKGLVAGAQVTTFVWRSYHAG